MKISCIIPARDRAHLLPDAIDSAAGQQDAEVEVVVVDDGSTDETLAMLARCYPQVTVVRLDGQGPGPARNAGAAAASGDLLMFLDSDDCWRPDHAARLVAVIGEGFEVAYGTTLTRDELSGESFLIPEPGQGTSGECLAALCRWCFLVPSSVAMSRSAFETAGGFGRESFGEDWHFFIRLAGRYPFGFAGPEPITDRLLHAESLCSQTDPATLIAMLASLRATAESFDDTAGQRFAAMGEWLLARDRPLTTVQDWFLAMKEEGLL